MKKIITVILIVFSLILFSGCNFDHFIEVPTEYKNIEIEENESIKVPVIHNKGTSVKWVSSNPSVASVNNGVIFGVTEGNAIISIIMVDHEKTKCLINVQVTKEKIHNIEIMGPDFIYLGNSAKYSIKVDPENAEIEDITWSVSNRDIAVMKNGVVQGLGVGETLVKAQYTYLNETYYLEKKIEIRQIDVDNIELTYKKSMAIGDIQTISYNINPSNATFQNVSFKSVDESILEVDINGTVKAIGKGIGTIIVTSTTDETERAYAIIEVHLPKVTKITIDHKKDVLTIGEKDSLTVKVFPSIAMQDYKFSVMPADVATIDENGKLTALKAGTATVKATAVDGSNVSCEYQITVKEPLAETIVIKHSKDTLKIGETDQLYVDITSKDAIQDYTLTVSPSYLAKIDENNLLTALEEGVATITAISSDNNASFSYDLNIVKPLVTTIDMNVKTTDIELLKEVKINIDVLPKTALQDVNLEVIPSSAGTIHNNVFKALKEGEAIIRAVACDGSSVFKEIKLNIYTPKATTLNITHYKNEMVIGETDTLSIYVFPLTASKDVEFEITPKDYAKVSKDGTLTALKDGNVTITAKTVDGSNLVSSYDLLIKKPKGNKIVIDHKLDTMVIGQTDKLDVKIFPENAHQNYEIKLEPASLAKLEGNTLMALEEGLLTVKAIDINNENNFTEYKIQINKPLTDEIIINHSKDVLHIGETDQLTFDINPLTASKDITIDIFPKDFVSLSEDGTLTALKEGEVLIRALSTDGSNVYSEYTLSIIKPLATEIVVSNYQNSMNVGDKTDLTITILPEQASQEFEWVLSEKPLIIIDKNNTLTALKAGRTFISARTLDGSNKTFEFEINISNPLANSIDISYNKSKLYINETDQLSVNILPALASKAYKLSVTPSYLANIDETGKLTALAEGTAIVKAETIDGSNLYFNYTLTIEKPKVDSITITHQFDKLYIGDKDNLGITVAPILVSNSYKWDVFPSDCAKIDDNNVLTALKAGKVLIRAISTDGSNIYDEYQLDILVPPVDSIVVNHNKETLFVGESDSISVKIYPANANQDYTLSFTPSDLVSYENGVLTALRSGRVLVSAVAKNDSNNRFEYFIDILVPTAEDIIINCDKTNILINENTSFTVNILPEFANKNYNIEVTPENIITINDGLITGINEGTATIKVTTLDGTNISKQLVINVLRPQTETIKIVHGPTTLFVGQSDDLEVIVTPELASNKYQWQLTPENIASIDENNHLVALNPGTVSIKVFTTDGTNLLDNYTLTVLKNDKKGVTINNKYYATIQEAINNAQNGDVLNVSLDSIIDPFTIDRDGITIQSLDETKSKVTISSILTINANVKNITLKGLKFIDNSAISILDGNQENITIDNCEFINVICETHIGVITFYGQTKNFKFINSKVDSNKVPRFFRFKQAIDGLTIANSEFINSSPQSSNNFDWAYLDHSLGGNVTITNNKFGNTKQSGFMIRGLRSGNFLFKDNEFTDIDNAAIDFRSLVNVEGVEPKVTLNIIHNIFNNNNVNNEDNWGCIRLRFKGVKIENLDVNINYNQFINWNLVNLVEDAGADQYKYKIPCIDFDHNYVDGLSSSDLDFTNLLGGIGLTWNNIYTDLNDLEKAYLNTQLDENPHALLVGTTTMYQKKPFATLKEALEAAKDNDIIYLLPGAHTGDVTVNKSNITITSLNGDLNPLDASISRKEEATYDGKITIAKELLNVQISGIKFINQACIVTTAGAEGAANAEKTNLVNFRLANNIVESALSTGEAFFQTVEAMSSYSHDMVIENNYFKAVEGFGANAMVMIDNNYDIKVIGNKFENIVALNALHFFDTTKGLSGNNVNIDSNEFVNINGNAIKINWLSVLPLRLEKTAIVSLQNNKFDRIMGTAIEMGRMNNSDSYKAINVRFNTFKDVNIGASFDRVHSESRINFNFNTFKGIPSEAYIKYGSELCFHAVELNATDNLYLDYNGLTIIPSINKFVTDIPDMIVYDTTITDASMLPTFSPNATSIEIILPDNLYVGDQLQAIVKYGPEYISNFGVKWTSSDSTVATVDKDGNVKVLKDGHVEITATYLYNESVKATKVYDIINYTDIKFDFDNDGYLEVNESFTIKASLEGLVQEGKIVWESSNPTVASVDQNGKVTALKDGEATISATLEGSYVTTTYTVVVKDTKTMNELLKLLVENNNGVVWNQTINYCGYEQGFESVPHNVYGSVNNYFAGTIPTVTEKPIPEGNKNIPGAGEQIYMKSLEFITIHDTGSATESSTAWQNSSWCVNPSNEGTSWHYTIGNDGIFHQFDDHKIAWHAGDGISWGDTTELRNTGIKADPDLRKRGVVTIKDGYFYVNDQKTEIKIPEGAEANAPVNTTGFVCVVKDGYYHLPTAYIIRNSNVVSARGGGLNSIGIETTVNKGSDVYLTWQYTAKHVANLLVKYNLGPDRVVFHNSWSNKMCPQTMIRANKAETFLDMVYAEYYVLKNFKDYKIEFISNNPDIIDNTGRVVGIGPYTTTEVSYTIRVTKGIESLEAVCHSVVQGSYTH